MTLPELNTFYKEDARRWADAGDSWRFGPAVQAHTVPALLPNSLLALALRTFADLRETR